MRQNSLAIAIVTILAAAACVTACSPTVVSRGTVIDPDKLAAVQPGNTREDVAATLGSPAIISSYDDKVWYYVSRKTEQYSFFDPKVTEQQAVEVRFDDAGKVVAVDKLDLSAARDIDPLEQRTPTYGNDNTFIQQLLGNLSRPIPHTNTNRGGQ